MHNFKNNILKYKIFLILKRVKLFMKLPLDFYHISKCDICMDKLSEIAQHDDNVDQDLKQISKEEADQIIRDIKKRFDEK